MLPKLKKVTKFMWSDDAEPHATRRRKLLESHPEVKQLYSPEPALKWICLLIIFTHTAVGILIKDSDWALVILQATIYGGFAVVQLQLMLHETCHNCTFGKENFMMNRYFEIFANLPMLFPSATNNWYMHRHHHDNLGQGGIDFDLPLEYEGKYFNTTFKKIIWALIHPFLYNVRIITWQKKHEMDFTDLHLLNIATCILFTVGVTWLCGWKTFAYFAISAYVAMVPLHPAGFNLITNHFQFYHDKELYSYDGPLNLISFNLGLHVEHHDLPSVTGRYLPMVKKIAPELYQDIGVYRSASWCYWQFFTNDSLNPYCRVLREPTKTSMPRSPPIFAPFVNTIKEMFLPKQS